MSAVPVLTPAEELTVVPKRHPGRWLAAAAGAGVNVVLALKAGQVEPAAAAAKTFDDHVVAWHLEAGGSPEEFAATAKALHGAGARSDLILPAADADELARLVEAGLGPLMDAVVLRHDWPDRDAIRAVQAADPVDTRTQHRAHAGLQPLRSENRSLFLAGE